MTMIARRNFLQLAAAAAASPLLRGDVAPYHEIYRPQFHFTPKTGWTNDPNGLLWYQGEYHLFFQHNPFDTKWGNMTWGHAISPDLVHWRQMENALLPDQMGTMFSGSGIVDTANTAGLQKGSEKTLVVFYTAAGGTSDESKGQPYTQCMAYSNDRGRTWTKYAGNPVVSNIAPGNRDPKVVWHAPTRKWIMVMYLSTGGAFRFLSSPDLKTWTKLQDISVPDCGECPDFFEIPVEGEPGETRWVWTCASDRYLVGTFDGLRFIPEVMTQPGHHGQNYYAVQTYSNIPGGRRIQLGWMNKAVYPGMPFNQQMSFPYELRLKRFPYTLKLCSLPAKEIELLHEPPQTWSNLDLDPGANPLSGLSGDLWDIHAEIDPGEASEVGFRIRGRKVSYTVKPKEKRLYNGEESVAITPPASGHLGLRILVDRTSVEVFANDGEWIMPSCFVPKPEDQSLALFATGGRARVLNLRIHRVKSIWP
jgi:sucrose-6-phosphate hydrolase SacC (GH32 family)